MFYLSLTSTCLQSYRNCKMVSRSIATGCHKAKRLCFQRKNFLLCYSLFFLFCLINHFSIKCIFCGLLSFLLWIHFLCLLLKHLFWCWSSSSDYKSIWFLSNFNHSPSKKPVFLRLCFIAYMKFFVCGFYLWNASLFECDFCKNLGERHFFRTKVKMILLHIRQ